MVEDTGNLILSFCQKNGALWPSGYTGGIKRSFPFRTLMVGRRA